MQQEGALKQSVTLMFFISENMIRSFTTVMLFSSILRRTFIGLQQYIITSQNQSICNKLNEVVDDKEQTQLLYDYELKK